MQDKIITDRLELNFINEEDHDFIFTLVNSKGWLEFIGDRNIRSKQDSLDYIKKLKNIPDLIYWVVRLKEYNTPIGIVSFLKRSYLENFDIGFAFLPEYHGNGYAFEAAQKVLSIAENSGEYSPVLATTIPRNTSSINLLTKLGLNYNREILVGNDTLHVYSTAQKMDK